MPIPASQDGYLETGTLWPSAHWHSYSGHDLNGQTAVDQFERYSDGSSDGELAAMGYEVGGSSRDPGRHKDEEE